VNLKLVEKEDLPLLQEWYNRLDFFGEYNSLRQVSRAEMEKLLDRPVRPKSFFIQKKDGTRVGGIESRDLFPGSDEGGREIGYCVLPNERGHGYCTEAVNIMLDYTFLSTPVRSVRLFTLVKNLASQRVAEKTGFKRDGIIRGVFCWGEWTDSLFYSILRDEWKVPRILKSFT